MDWVKIEWTPQARHYHRVATIVVALTISASAALDLIYTRSLKIAAKGNNEAFRKIVEADSHRVNFIGIASIGCLFAPFLFAVRKTRLDAPARKQTSVSLDTLPT